MTLNEEDQTPQNDSEGRIRQEDKHTTHTSTVPTDTAPRGDKPQTGDRVLGHTEDEQHIRQKVTMFWLISINKYGVDYTHTITV